jgi:hypothetical protein
LTIKLAESHKLLVPRESIARIFTLHGVPGTNPAIIVVALVVGSGCIHAVGACAVVCRYRYGIV